MAEILVLTKELLKKNLSKIMKEVKGFEFINWKNKDYLIELPGKWNFSFIAFINNSVSGFSINSDKSGTFYIHFLYVFKKFRNKGIGKSLLKKCENISRTNRIATIHMKCHKNNFNALNFYFYNNFYIKNIDNNENYYLMEKRLV